MIIVVQTQRAADQFLTGWTLATGDHQRPRSTNGGVSAELTRSTCIRPTQNPSVAHIADSLRGARQEWSASPNPTAGQQGRRRAVIPHRGRKISRKTRIPLLLIVAENTAAAPSLVQHLHHALADGLDVEPRRQVAELGRNCCACLLTEVVASSAVLDVAPAS